MDKPAIPADEASRLEALAALKILDTQPEERFDRYTRLARKMFNVPVALFSLVDRNRQWIKSRQGLDIDETPRDISFCGHTILGDQPLVVEDATADKRFADNPLVMQEPNIRFYAGRPIRAPDGSKVGTLCIIDHASRTFDESDAAALDDLAQLVESEFKPAVKTTTDPLTKLTNRRGFLDIAHHVVTICERTGIPATLLYFNIDNPGTIFEQLGTQQSNEIVRQFAKILLETFRVSDIIARLDKEEFCALLTGADKTTTLIPLNRLYAALDNLSERETFAMDLDVSYGMVSYDRNQHHSIADLLAEADTLMYVHRKMRNRKK